jgi:hypothetical protein
LGSTSHAAWAASIDVVIPASLDQNPAAIRVTQPGSINQTAPVVAMSVTTSSTDATTGWVTTR